MNTQRAKAASPWRRARQYGLTLIELMVGMIMGLLILSGLVTLFANANRSNIEITKNSKLLDGGRFVMQILTNDLVHAGFWDAYVPAASDSTISEAQSTAAIPDPCVAFSDWDDDHKKGLLDFPVQVYEDAPFCTGIIVNKQSETDVLVVRHASTCGLTWDTTDSAWMNTACATHAADQVYFQTSLCYEDGDEETAPSSSASYVLDLGSASFNLTHSDCTTPAAVRQFHSTIYYVRDYGVTEGDGIPTLVRSQFSSGAHQTAEPLVYGVEGLHVELGIDDKVTRCGLNTVVNYGAGTTYVNPTTCLEDADRNSNTLPTNRGDGIVDTFVGCTNSVPCTAAQLLNTVAVKVFVLMRTPESTADYTNDKTYCLGSVNINGTCPTTQQRGPFNDHYKRYLFTTTIRLTNIVFRRITP